MTRAVPVTPVARLGLRRTLAVGGLLLLAACGGAGSPATKPPSPGSVATDPVPQTSAAPTSAPAPRGDGPWPLLRATGGGSATIVEGAGVAGSFDNALVSADGSTLIVAEPSGDDTRVTWVDVATGTTREQTTLPGALQPVSADARGHDVALTTPLPERKAGEIGPGRSDSHLVFVTTDDIDHPRTFDLDINAVPEAFNTIQDTGAPMPSGAFLIEYLPAEHPTEYRVRTIDLVTGDVGLPVSLRDKAFSVDQQMAGLSRTQVLSRQSQLLFTLYTEGSAEHLYSFVHTLGLFNGVWCINLPRELGLETSAGTLALAPDERTLYVVSNEGRIAEIGTDIDTQLEVGRWVDLGAKGGAVSDVPAMAVDLDDVWVALDQSVLRVDRDDLTVVGELPLPEAASAIAIAPPPPGDASASERLYVAGASAIYELDAGDGAVLRQVALPTGQPPVDRLTVG
jgi:hypothetical protein